MAKRAASKRSGGGSLDADTRICVLHGPDELLKRELLQGLRQAITEAHGEVETFTFDGKSAALADVFDELRSYSLMQTHKLVIVDEADEFTKNHRAALERYAEAPMDHATLVLRSGTWNKGNLDKLIDKVGAVIKCDAPKPAEARKWLIDRATSAYRRKLTPAAAEALIARMGTDRMMLDTELAKLALMVDERQAIEPSLVEQVVGRSSEEQAWAVQEAVLSGLVSGRPGQVLAKVHELVDLAGQPEVRVAYFVADLVRKLNVGLMMQAAGVPASVIAKELKLWGPRQSMFMQVMGKLDGRSAGRLFDQAVEADARSKSGFGEAMRNLECFCVRLADELR